MIDWVQEIKTNENKALSKIYTEFREVFIASIRKDNKVSAEEAIELFQTSVIIMYDNIIQGKIDHLDNIKSYLFTIGKNKAFELFRRKKKQSNFEDISFAHYVAEESNNEKAELEKDIAEMQIILRRMGDPCKTLLELFYFKKLSNSEIASLMEYQNENTVKTKKYKCIQRARKFFSQQKQSSNE